jgi:hypothetical protein
VVHRRAMEEAEERPQQEAGQTESGHFERPATGVRPDSRCIRTCIGGRGDVEAAVAFQMLLHFKF